MTSPTTKATRPHGEGDHVVPVTSDCRTPPGGKAAGGEGALAQSRQALWEQAALQRAGPRALRLVEPRPLQGLRDERAHGRQEAGFLLGERGVPPLVAEDADAEGVTGRGQRKVDDGMRTGRLGEVDQLRIPRPVLPHRAHEDGFAAHDGLTDRIPLQERPPVDLVEHVSRHPSGAERVDPAVLDDVHQQEKAARRPREGRCGPARPRRPGRSRPPRAPPRGPWFRTRAPQSGLPRPERPGKHCRNGRRGARRPMARP